MFDGIVSVSFARLDAWIAGSVGGHASHFFPFYACPCMLVCAKTRGCVTKYRCGWSLRRELLRVARERGNPGWMGGVRVRYEATTVDDRELLIPG